jgi:hypothetical protein
MDILKRLMLAYRQRMAHLEAGMKQLDDLDRAFTWRRWWQV